MERIELSAETLQLEETVEPLTFITRYGKSTVPEEHRLETYKVKRNPEGRKVFHIDVGNYGKKEAEDYLVGYKSKQTKPDAGYFFCPYVPSMDLKIEHINADSAGENKTLTDLMAAEIAAEIDEQVQNDVLSVAETKTDWAKIVDSCWDSIAMTAKLEMLGIDKSFIGWEGDLSTTSFDNECNELAEDLDEFEMMVEFNKIADPNWTEERTTFALNLFKQGWKAKVRVDESCDYKPESMQEDYFFSSTSTQADVDRIVDARNDFITTYYYDTKPFLTREEIQNCIITSEL